MTSDTKFSLYLALTATRTKYNNYNSNNNNNNNLISFINLLCCNGLFDANLYYIITINHNNNK